MPFSIVRNDITKMAVDAIVNAANTELLMGGGVCGAIFAAAGAERLQAACAPLAPIKTGEAVITEGFDLPAKYVIHTAGPVYHDGEHGEGALLRSCYIRSLELAAENGCESIAFPLISAGIYGYPKDEALRVATTAILEFITGYEQDIDVSLVVFGNEALVASEKLLEVKSYIDEHYLCEGHDMRRLLMVEREALEAKPEKGGEPIESFSGKLLQLMEASGKKDSEIYNRANISRQHFSKIKSTKDYSPSKPTVLSFAIALELSLEETNDLLARAGFALSHASKFDLVIESFITRGKYDIFEIDEVLFEMAGKCLVD